MDKKKIEKELLAKAENKSGKLFITCNNAFEIAENLNIDPVEVGKMCNVLKIKIMNCKLGCF